MASTVLIGCASTPEVSADGLGSTDEASSIASGFVCKCGTCADLRVDKCSACGTSDAVYTYIRKLLAEDKYSREEIIAKVDSKFRGQIKKAN